jgi:L-seryl-tRNA(Ser) seleniumtransferase
MAKPNRPIPSVDEVLRTPMGRGLVERYGHPAVVAAVRAALDEVRSSTVGASRVEAVPPAPAPTRADMVARVATRARAALEAAERPRLQRVLNLTGTVLHTNLGRALLPEAAVDAVATAMRHPAALEFDLAAGARGERDDIVRDLVTELTGAEDAIVVNNNAAALVLVLDCLAKGRETVVSRGELIEIGGSFRLPAIMETSGTRLREVGTTNRTHLADYRGALGPETALVMKVHTSNYRVMGFTAEVAARDLAALTREAGVPLLDDLGSGTLVDLAPYGLPPERTVREAIADGADLVTFSGDKLLGGPQAGFIVGRRDLVRRCAKHPLKRALRLDKLRLAALEATLRLYRDPDRLAARLPTLRLLTRSLDELEAMAGRLLPVLQAACGAWARATIEPSTCQIGSGSLPLETLPSIALTIEPVTGGGAALARLAEVLRTLPIPLIGRLEKGRLRLDLRTLEDEAALAEMLALAAAPLAVVSSGPHEGSRGAPRD